MDGWITFWKIAYVIGMGSFFVLAIVIVPLGARDLLALFRHLERKNDVPPQPTGRDEKTDSL
jgi:hypothetical protein